MRDNPLHEQVIYESIMDGCVYLGDEFISVISDDKINLDTVAESISGYIINNCKIYGINSENFEIKESSLNDVVSTILEEKRYEYYTGVFYEQLFELSAVRAEMLKRGANYRIKSAGVIGKAADKMITRGAKRLKDNSGGHFKKVGDHLTSGGAKNIKSAIKHTLAGTAQGAVGAADAGIGYARKGMAKYLKASGEKQLKRVPEDHKTPGIFKPVKLPKFKKPNIPFLNRKKKQQQKQEEATV